MNNTIIELEYFQCIGIELPETGIECSQLNSTVCVKCEIRGAYLTSPNTTLGELICKILLSISLLLGVFGLFTNFIISCVLYKRKAKRSVDFLLLTFALADFLGCFISIFVCVTPLIYHCNFVNILLLNIF